MRAAVSRAGVIAAAAALCLVGCEGGEAGDPAGRRGGRGPGGAAAPAPAVGVEAVRRQTVRKLLVGHAALEPEAEVALLARAEGRVVDLSVEAGDVVEQGQVLARLEDVRARLSVREAELALAQAKTSRARQEGLAAKGLASKEELDLAREAVRQAELALEGARLDLADTALRSPIAGVVTAREISLGAHLRPGDAAFRLADREPLLAKLRVPEAQADLLEEGQRARISIEGVAGAPSRSPILGEVLRVGPVVDRASGTVVATIAVTGAGAVRIGRFATVEVVVEERPDRLVVPLAALALRGDSDRVLVCEPGEGRAPGVLRVRPVELGVQDGDRVEVLAGLSEGDLVVVAAPDDARDGMPARPVRQDAASAAAVGSASPTAPGGGAPAR